LLGEFQEFLLNLRNFSQIISLSLSFSLYLSLPLSLSLSISLSLSLSLSVSLFLSLFLPLSLSSDAYLCPMIHLTYIMFLRVFACVCGWVVALGGSQRFQASESFFFSFSPMMYMYVT